MPEEQQSLAGDLDVEFGHISGVVIGAVVVAAYAAWAIGDIVSWWFGFLATALVAGYLLYGREDDRDKLVFVVYSLAGLIALTPVLLFFIPDLLSDRTEIIFQTISVVFTLLFVTLGGIVGYVGYRLNGGQGVIQRARARFTG